MVHLTLLKNYIKFSKKKGDLNNPLTMLGIAVVGIAVVVIAKGWDTTIGASLKLIVDGAITKIKSTTGF